MGLRNINGRSPQEVQSPYFFSLHPKTCADDDRRNIQETYEINAQRSEVTTNEVGAWDAVQGSRCITPDSERFDVKVYTALSEYM